ncbi:hypothetical protein DFH11DRAFT_1647164 [Phellopilus nigrolimitatus]|nr:hypothetical protein DFH11DRAFT_1647164 [Phellopilus nigrolimitatus]
MSRDTGCRTSTPLCTTRHNTNISPSCSSTPCTASSSPLLSRYMAPRRHHDVAEERGRLTARVPCTGTCAALECAFDFFIPSLEKRECVALMIQQRPARVQQTLHEMQCVAPKSALQARAWHPSTTSLRRVRCACAALPCTRVSGRVCTHRVARPHLSLRRARAHEAERTHL